MLELTRKKNESIIIDDDIKITVLSDKHGQVRLGIEVPEDVKIRREEIYKEIDLPPEEYPLSVRENSSYQAACFS